MTTKITREQLKVLEDAYVFEKLISDGPGYIALGPSVEPQWENALKGEALVNARTLERDLISAAWHVDDPTGEFRQSLYEITCEALGLEDAKEVIDMYHVWELVYYFERVLMHLYFMQARTESIAQDLGQAYDDDKKLNAAIANVRDLFYMVRRWEKVAAQRFVETGSARPAREAATGELKLLLDELEKDTK
ncbi:hypothetical protein [Gleimia europaea]|uniref:hypothetical protein n=1 Tax=Gleimia europaea TaxID=66228 RepID=UPI000C808368|nr:hypothetical protein [Gleimia europaea]WIK62597.1 hypothetical protein CJ185_008790 [Gleimia europaea]